MVVQHNSAAAGQDQSVAPCRHHWVIEPANGPVSRGVCQVCEETREFKNSIGEAEREYEGNPVFRRGEVADGIDMPEE